MLANKQLSARDFEISFQIKMAMNMLNSENPLAAKENLMAALRTLHT